MWKWLKVLFTFGDNWLDFVPICASVLFVAITSPFSSAPIINNILLYWKFCSFLWNKEPNQSQYKGYIRLLTERMTFTNFQQDRFNYPNGPMPPGYILKFVSFRTLQVGNVGIRKCQKILFYNIYKYLSNIIWDKMSISQISNFDF